MYSTSDQINSIDAKISENRLFIKIYFIILISVPFLAWYFYKIYNGWDFETILIVLCYGSFSIYGIHKNIVETEILKIKKEQLGAELHKSQMKKL